MLRICVFGKLAVVQAIRDAIHAGGAIPFSEFQRLALYGPDGLYSRVRGGRAGRRRADFITSPEVGPLFGAVLPGTSTTRGERSTSRRLSAWWMPGAGRERRPIRVVRRSS